MLVIEMLKIVWNSSRITNAIIRFKFGNTKRKYLDVQSKNYIILLSLESTHSRANQICWEVQWVVIYWTDYIIILMVLNG